MFLAVTSLAYCHQNSLIGALRTENVTSIFKILSLQGTFINTVSEFNEFKPRLKYHKNQF